MSNDIGKPSEDIKKYDFGFATKIPQAEDSTPASNIKIPNTPIVPDADANDLFGEGLTDEERTQVSQYNEALEEEAGKPKRDYSMGGFEKTGRSLVTGLGDVFEGLGDAADWLDGTPSSRLIQEKNLSEELFGEDLHKPMSDWFHKMGVDLQAYGDTVPGLEKIQDVTWSDMMTGDFWKTHWARALPFTLTFLIPGTGGMKAAGYGYRGLSLLAGKGPQALRAGRMLAKTGLVTAEKGSKIAKTFTQFLGGAAAGNMSEGAIIAGQTLNDAIEQGVPLPLAAEAAADVFRDNLKWMAIDGLQLAMFTGTVRAINPFAKSIRTIKAPGMKRFMQNMAKVSGYSLTDGVFEQFQEVYQDWTMRRRIAEQKGEEFMDYLDYFNSKEALPTRVIAFTSSLAVTGARTTIQQAAERKRLFAERLAKDGLVQENLEMMEMEVEDYDMEGKSGTPEGPPVMVKAKDQFRSMKITQMVAYMIRSFARGKIDYFKGYIQDKVEKGRMTQKEADSYLETVKELEKAKEVAPDYNLNEEEQAYLLQTLMTKNSNMKTWLEQKERLENEKQKIKDSDLSEKQKAEQLKGIDNELANHEDVKKAIEKTANTQVENIMADNAKRRQEERINKEVVPVLKRIIKKQNRNQELTEEENKVLKDNESRYQELKNTQRLEDAKKKVGRKFVQVENLEEGNNDLIFQKEVKTKGKLKKDFRSYEEKRVDENGNVTTTKHTELDILKKSEEYKKSMENTHSKLEEIADKESNNQQLNEEEKELIKGNFALYNKIHAQKQKSAVEEKLKEEKAKDVEEEKKSKEQIEKEAQQKKINESKARDIKRGFLGRVGIGDKSFTRITFGQRVVWAENYMKENPGLAVYFDENLTDEHGRATVGAFMGLSMFINPDVVTQEGFLHEGWHFYQAIFKGSPEIKALLKEVIKQPIYTQIKNQHHVKIKYTKNGIVENLGEIIFKTDILSWTEWTKKNEYSNRPSPSIYAQYMEYISPLLKEKGYEQLPDSKQDDIQNEALATAGGFNDANNSDFFIISKRETKFQKAMKAAWKMIHTKLSKKVSEDIIKEHYPTLYSNDFATMLDNARNEFAKEDKQRTYESLKREKTLFYMHATEKLFAKSSIEQAVLSTLPTLEGQVKTVLDTYIKTKADAPDSIDVQEMIHTLLSQRNTTLPEILTNAKYGLQDHQADLIDSYYNENSRDVDNILGAFYNGELQLQIEERYEQELLGEEMYQELVEESETAFGKIIAEDYSRKVNSTVSRMVKDFLDEYNQGKTGDQIKNKLTIYQALEEQLRDTKNDFELFNSRIRDLEENTRQARLEDNALTTKEELLASFIVHLQGKMSTPNDVIYSMWHYFRSFTLEKGNHWVISSDGKVSLYDSIPYTDEKKIRGFVNGAIEKIKDGENYKDSLLIVSILEQMRNPKTKNQAIVNFLSKFYEEWNPNKLINIDQVESLRIDGKKVKNYFSEKKIDELQSALLNLNWNAYWANGKTTEEFDKYWQVHKQDILKNVSEKAQGLLADALRRDFDKFRNLSTEEQLARKNGANYFWFNSKKKVRSLSLNMDNFKSLYSDLYRSLYASSYYHAGYSALSGMTKNAAGDTVDLFSKSSYVHNNINHLSEILPGMKEDEFNTLFGANTVAAAMRFGYVPKLSTVLGVYDEGTRKGKKNSQVKARTFTNARMMHLIDRIMDNASEYSHFIGQLGDSSRLYHVDNAHIWTDDMLESSLESIASILGRKFTGEQSNSKQLLDQLIEDGHIKEEQRDKYKDAVTKAVKVNYVNKYYYSDLFYNRAYVENKYEVTQDTEGNVMKVERLIEDLSKRVKGIASPLISMHGKRIEPIIIKDPRPGGIQLADSASYMTKEHAVLMKAHYGALENVGNNMKTLFYGQNLDNTTFARKMQGQRIPLYLKTHTHVLTAQTVNKHENLKYINTVLKYRAQFLPPNVIPVVYFDSAIKGGLVQSQKDQMSYTMEEIKEFAIDIESSRTGKNRVPGLLLSETTFIKKQNDLYSFVKDGAITSGFDGGNFGIQNTLDNYNRTSIFSKQYTANLNVLNTIPSLKGMDTTGSGALTVINRLLGDIKRAQYAENFEGKDFNDIYDEQVQELYSWVDGYAVQEFGPHFMGNERFYNNVVASYVKKNVFQTRMPGTLSTEMTDIGYNYKVGIDNVVTDEQLKSYRLEDGKVEVAEIVISKTLAKQNKVKVGDFVFAARIPNSKIGDGLVFKVKEILNAREGNAVIIPSRHAALIGSDKDGDQLHIAVLNKKEESKLKESERLKNELLNYLFELYQQPEMTKLIMQEVDFNANITDRGVDHIRNNKLNKEELKEFDRIQNDLNIMDEQVLQDRFIGNNVMLGIVASLNRAFNYFASGIGTKLKPQLKTQIRYKEGKPMRMTIINSLGKSEQLGYVENVNDNDVMAWLNYAQFLNFIIDDGKFGNRAKFKMQEESANHFAFLLRMGLSLETVIDVMYDPVYVEYIKERAKGANQSEAISKVTMLDNDRLSELRSVSSVTAPYEIDLNKGTFDSNPVGFASLVIGLDSFGKEMRTFQRIASLDSKMPANYFEAYVLRQEFTKALKNQVSLAKMFESNPDLVAQLDLFDAYTAKKLEESIINEEDVKLIYNTLGKTFDFSKAESIQFVYDALRFNKMAVYMNPSALASANGNHKGGSFHDLLFNYTMMTEEGKKSLAALEEKYSGKQLIEEKLKLINDNALALIIDNSNNGFIQLLKVRKDRKVMRNYKSDGRITTKYFNSIDISRDTHDSIRSEEHIKSIRKEFAKLPEGLQNYLIAYEFFNNKFGTTGSSFLMYLPDNVRKEVKRTSDHINNPKNRSKNNVRNEMLYASELLSGPNPETQKFFTEYFIERMDQNAWQTSDAVFLFRMVEILNAFSSKKFLNALNPYTESRRSMADESYTQTKDGKTIVHQLTTPVISKPTKEESKKYSKDDQSLYGKTLLKIEWDIIISQDGKEKRTKQYYIVEGDTNIQEINSILTYSGALQENYQGLKSKGIFYMHQQDGGSFMFGQDPNFTLDEFAKETNLIKWSQSMDEIKSSNPELYNKAYNEWTNFRNGIKEVKKVREKLEKDPNIYRITKTEDGEDIQFTEEENIKFAKDLPGYISQYYNALTDVHVLAKSNLQQELQYMYGEAMSNEQQTYWRNTKEGRVLIEKTSSDDRLSDITIAEMLMSPGDFGQNHPTLAAVRRSVERGNQLMHRDLKRATEELNEAYMNLYKSKYGLLTKPVKFISNMPLLRLLKSSESVSEKLFENLLFRNTKIEKQTIDGKTSYSHDTVHQLNKAIFDENNKVLKSAYTKMKQGIFSKEEIAYAEVISRYTQFYNHLALTKGLYTQKRLRYAPLADASRYEVLRKRGIYGIYYKEFGKSGSVGSVKIKAFNPLSGKEEIRRFSEFQAIYSSTKQEVKVFLQENPHLNDVINLNDFSQINRIAKVRALKALATQYYNKGKDVEGNVIEKLDGVNEVITMESKTFNRYFSQRSHRAEYLASGNLQYSMYNYIKTMIFQHGTEFYDGNNWNRIEYVLPNKDSSNKKRESQIYIKDKARIRSSKEMYTRAQKGLLSKEKTAEYAVPNFQGFDAFKFQLGAAMTYLKNSGALSTNSVNYLQKTILESFIMQRPKRTVTPFPVVEKKLVESFVNLTMRIGLGLNFTAAMFNVAIGKYNAWRSQGTAKFVRAHFRYLGINNITGAFSFSQARKTTLLLEEFGILTYRPEEQLEGAKYQTVIDRIFFWPMVTAEKFIQEIQFIGELSEEQWNAYDVDKNGNLIIVDDKNVLTVDDIARMQRRVQNMQGRGYSAIDQRLIQQYVLGSAMLQFKRWFPTYLADRIGKGGYLDYIDDFGDIYTGTLKAFATEDGQVKLSKYVSPMHYIKFALDPNLWNPSMKKNDQYVKDGLTKSQTEALQRLHRGMAGLMMTASLLLMVADDDDDKLTAELRKLVEDMSLLLNVEKWSRMIIAPAFTTFETMWYLIKAIVLQQTYKRDAKYGLKGEGKWKTFAAGLTPNIGIPGTDVKLKTKIWGAPQKANQAVLAQQRKLRKIKEKWKT